MVSSDSAKKLIKQFEGLKLDAYKCPAGCYTIGYGHTRGVHEGMVILEEDAERFLDDDIAIVERQLNSVCSINNIGLNQNQFDALVSFTFNCGVGNLKKLVKNRSVSEIGNAMVMYNKANGKKLNGLVKRRNAEKELFFEKVSESEPSVYPVKVQYFIKPTYRIRNKPNIASDIVRVVQRKELVTVLGITEMDWVMVPDGFVYRDGIGIDLVPIRE